MWTGPSVVRPSIFLVKDDHWQQGSLMHPLRKFCRSQALGGRQNAHKRQKEGIQKVPIPDDDGAQGKQRWDEDGGQI